MPKAGLGRASVEKQGREIVDKAFGILNDQLTASEYVAGENLSIADAALFYVERWAPKLEIALPPNLQSHFEKMFARRSVQYVREQWGET